MEQPLPVERHRRIQEILRGRQAARVSTLSDLLGVSEVTIRRDLEDLDRRGVLERTHGGAILSQRTRAELAYGEATARHSEQKRWIGEAAARLVQPGDTIFMNGGTTTLQVFRNLDLPDIRVVTNHIGIALEASTRSFEVLLAGGEFRTPSNSCVGAFATDTVRKVFASRAFIGVEGVSRRAGLTAAAAEEANIALVMIDQTRGPVVVVADSSKIGTVADFVVSPLDEISQIVTDPGIDDEYRLELDELGVEVLVAGGAPAEVGLDRG
ncbi:MAG TPA: DeoR/GlpR family DNA-binding transcription regulator [Actinomycetota bacterium]|jgi:DeoR/GlpR family transcriptional regulator of sugar metabolism|nr:DeoR/GlpR family DNA-binding transcription regulator [Actinomycetota bacterium]